MCSIILNNASSSSLPECSKILYSSSIIKNYSSNALQTSDLSSCKYYALNSLILFRKIQHLGLNCMCIKLQNNQIKLFLKKTESSLNLKDCKMFTNRTIDNLNLMVNDIISCKNEF
ncbi:hypothetical protein OA264_01210 [Alphaproteobacteria bacterium]|nr:hypothetical protein [Alphaproteobacteria bacterium]